MLEHGAVLIRGFRIVSPPDFERTIKSLQPNLCADYRGTSPRSVYENTEFMFSAADVPASYPIGQHIEMGKCSSNFSFSDSPVSFDPDLTVVSFDFV